VLKLSAVVLQALRQGAHASFVVGVEPHGRSRVLCLGFGVADHPVSPFVTFGTHPTRAEQRDLLECLTCGLLPLFAFDELSRCVLHMTCTARPADAAVAIQHLTRTAPHYCGANMRIRLSAMDRFQEVLEAERTGDPMAALAYCRVPLNVAPEASTKIIAVTEDGAGRFQLDDTTEGAEGSGLEQSIHQLLYNVFREHVHRSPQVGEKADRRELIDVMAISDFGTVLVESKVEAILATDPASTPERRAKRLNKAIEKRSGSLAAPPAMSGLRSRSTAGPASGSRSAMTRRRWSTGSSCFQTCTSASTGFRAGCN
jgi:hypothetical protein